MKATRIFNNNAVATLLAGQEVIVIGNGIGFNLKRGDEVNEAKIEKTFYVQDDLQTKFLKMVENINEDVLEGARQIIELAKTQNYQINNQGLLALIDHIQFAVERYHEGIQLPNLMLSEIKMLYPLEYETGLQSLDIIEQNCKVCLADDEAGYIAIHLINNKHHQEMTYDTLKFVNGTLKLMREVYGLEINDEDRNILRLSTHLKLLAQRFFDEEQQEDCTMMEMHGYLLGLNANNPEFIAKLKQFALNIFNKELRMQEELYLLVHLTKII